MVADDQALAPGSFLTWNPWRNLALSLFFLVLQAAHCQLLLLHRRQRAFCNVLSRRFRVLWREHIFEIYKFKFDFYRP